MIRHIAMFRFKDDAPESAARSLADGLAHLAGTISEISAYTYGPDLGLRSGNFDFAVLAEFVDAAAFAAYVDHPDHQTFIRDRLAPILAERASLQFEI